MKVSYKGYTAEEWADRYEEARETNRTLLEQLDSANLQNCEYREALEKVYKRLNDTVPAGYDIYPELSKLIAQALAEKQKCVHDGGTIPCDHQKPCPDHSCACGRAVANPGDKCLRCGGFAEKRKDEPECDCFVPALEGAGQHSPACAIFKNRG